MHPPQLHPVIVHLEGGVGGGGPPDPGSAIHHGHVVPRRLAAELVEDVGAAAEDVRAVGHRAAQVDARVCPGHPFT